MSRGDTIRATWILQCVWIFSPPFCFVCTLNTATCYIHSTRVATAKQSLHLVCSHFSTNSHSPTPRGTEPSRLV